MQPDQYDYRGFTEINDGKLTSQVYLNKEDDDQRTKIADADSGRSLLLLMPGIFAPGVVLLAGGPTGPLGQVVFSDTPAIPPSPPYTVPYLLLKYHEHPALVVCEWWAYSLHEFGNGCALAMRCCDGSHDD